MVRPVGTRVRRWRLSPSKAFFCPLSAGFALERKAEGTRTMPGSHPIRRAAWHNMAAVHSALPGPECGRRGSPGRGAAVGELDRPPGNAYEGAKAC
ncbi:hypothetical protein NDU88_006090 [Pleurodeles waltl]|uniref:Uncharacterized protein n=1 Tax=Pleurodeles waltl TaxID=8319 RepID=A0AAV7SNK9_PLEWA|nr:hypothetical protein NDU88_006090 [Pleurodeles waltl]